MSVLDTDPTDDLDADGEVDEDMQGGDLDQFAYDLNVDHFIRFTRRGPALLVTFDAMDREVEELSACHSRLDALAREMEWSTLSLLSRGHTWFRAPEVVQFFDALVDGTLLDQFAEVLFYGANSGGHAALSYSLTAPLCRVIALSPQWKLGADAPWDRRFPEAADIDFSRYLPTREHLETANAVYIPHDPRSAEELGHVAALASAATMPLACRHLTTTVEEHLIRLGVLDDLVVEAMGGTLDAPTFYTALRARRDDPAYLRRLVGRLIDADRPFLEALAVRNVAERTGRTRFAKRFEQIQARLTEAGKPVPARRTPAR